MTEASTSINDATSVRRFVVPSAVGRSTGWSPISLTSIRLRAHAPHDRGFFGASRLVGFARSNVRAHTKAHVTRESRMSRGRSWLPETGRCPRWLADLDFPTSSARNLRSKRGLADALDDLESPGRMRKNVLTSRATGACSTFQLRPSPSGHRMRKASALPSRPRRVYDLASPARCQNSKA